MGNQKVMFSGLATFAIAVVLFLFIKMNNDHLECGIETKTTTDGKGIVTTCQEHICREWFPL